MKKILKSASFFNFAVGLTIAITGFVILESCGTTSVTPEEGYNAGYTIGRLIRGE